MVTLITPFKGYTEGVLTGNRDDRKYEILLSSGYRIWLDQDEFI